jgi:predicted PolB exonuclease-like 3'-5' exonuclease
MLKLLPAHVWAFDAEWIPCVDTGRRVYGLASDTTDDEVRAHMFAQAGATAENPRPYLKTALCRVVSIAAVKRSANSNGVAMSLELVSLPKLGAGLNDERDIVGSFLNNAGRVRPQLVGFNSLSADLPALVQRALVHKVSSPRFCKRPNKPWEGIDYFGKHSDYNIDLKEYAGCFSYGKSTPSLNEMAAACGIPAKGGVSGGDVLELWLAGKHAEIIRYNQRDALTTYLLWLRVALFSGLMSRDQFDIEEGLVESMLIRMWRSEDRDDLRAFAEEWRGLVFDESQFADDDRTEEEAIA